MADIRYHFIADGVQTVRDGFRSIGEDAKTSSRRADEAMRQMRTASRETSREAGRGADYQRKLAEKVAKDQERNQKYVAAIKDRYFRDEQRKEEQAERLAQRNAARAEAQKQRTIAAAVSNRRKEIAKEISDRRSHEGRLEQISRSAADRRAEGERRHRRKLDEIKRASETRIGAIADRAKEATAARERARAFDGELVAKRRAYEIDKKRGEIRDRERDSLRDDIRGGVRGAVIGGAVATGALAAGITGAASRDALRLQEVSNRLSISARGAGEESVDPNVLRKEFEQTAIRTPGVKSIDIADAVAQFVAKTGNLDVARQSQGVFATVASATGSSIGDVSAAAADLFQKFDVNTVEGMADAMAALAFQGKSGAFELKDAAGQFAKLSAAASRFGLDKGAGGVRVLGGLTQIARTATGSPEQAATAVEAMFRQFTSGAAQKQLRSIGVNPFKDKAGTQTKDVRELIVETISKSGGNLTKLQGIFGDEGIRAISPIISKFNEAEKAQKGTGATAARAYVDEMVNAPGDFSELQKDAAQAQTDASAKLTQTWETLTAKIGESTLPVIERLAKSLESSPGAIDAFVSVIDGVVWYFGALVEATQMLLETFGLASKKTKTPEQIRDEERKKAGDAKARLDAFDRRRGGSWDEEARLRAKGDTKAADAMARKLLATSEMDDERATLAGKFEAAKRRVGEANADVAKVQDQQYNIRSAERFAQEYAQMLGPEEYQGQNMDRARKVGRALREGSLIDSQFTDDSALEGESDAAKQFRLNQVRARREDLQNAGVSAQGQSGAQTADKGAFSIAEAAAKMLAAAQKMEGAAGKVAQQGQASIVPQP